MSPKTHATIRIVDSLAEITRYHDRHIVEKSLLKSVDDLLEGNTTRLYRVEKEDNSIDIHLLAFCRHGVIDSLPNGDNISMPSSAAFEKVLETGCVLSVPHQQDPELLDSIYPAFDAEDEIFAVLIHTGPRPSTTEQRLVHGILKVYANYLTLIEKTQRDKLTGLFNRETLDRELTKILVSGNSSPITMAGESNDRRQRSGKLLPFVGVIDIDHFKSINDRFGHLFGDEILVLVSRLLAENFFRQSDLVFRYGGEEFVVIIHSATREDARSAFERLRESIEQHRFSQLDRVTISVGFVEVANQQTAADIIGDADEALYYAKHNGRNQVVSFDHLIEQGEIRLPEKVEHNDIELF
ncbi:GGDEF domain-containing protein [Pseudomaricurvus alkylphenolicus]|jgi:diguanylate cyclase (GGDEF)-like protein|uniref:GGDEF domain-containing protein n=1 Tax=Pseudomaricurvus alkylphenolicus TaxID=1306991 RepID=UPI00142081E4|nr:GGDEF domain-containing protein [Pseudomaricurvus alkylphenolicus]NIB40171.1 GGDEF domain-containing protein [Pseudomaricurvus alkylphenolicus]